MSFYLFRETETHIMWVLDLKLSPLTADLCGRHSQVGSLAGAAHLLKNNTDDLRSIQCEQKSHLEFKCRS